MIRIYNTLYHKKEVLKPRRSGLVNLFVCGPTVYDFSHIGHARTYVIFDVIVKYLRKRGLKVFYLQNITDIDDKIIKRARESKINPRELALKFQKAYLEDMKKLNVTSVNKYAGATKYIKEIISQVKRLESKGLAYQMEDGVYYDIGRFKNYGKLSKRTTAQAEDAVSRIDEAKNKRNKGDFSLWKLSKTWEPKWKSPWGYGRPGWHIEDTAITEKFFGSQYDMHGGARDLIFPHHEAEIAQMEGLSGKKPMVKYWLHSGFLLVGGQKMAKSLGNFITIRDFLKNRSPEILRFIILSAHYRSPIDYNETLAKQAKTVLERISEFMSKLTAKTGKDINDKYQDIDVLVVRSRREFYQYMDDDFNTPKALASLFDLIKQVNPLLDKNQVSMKDKKSLAAFFREVDKIFCILPKKEEEMIPPDIKKLVSERENSRKQKEWAKADEIRKSIEAHGYKIEDTASGPKIKKISI